jgi:hypothetical protein
VDAVAIAEGLATGILRRKVDGLANPFDAMPDAEWTRTVSYFAATRARLVPSPASLCLRLLYWISKGLTLDDAKAVFRRLCDPEVACSHRFPEQLDADLAGLVASALRRRKMLAEMNRRREEAAAPTGPAAFVRKLSESFPSPQE